MRHQLCLAKLLLLAAAAAASAGSDTIAQPIDLADDTPAGAWLADLRRILGLNADSAATLSILNPNHVVVSNLAINATAGYLYAKRAIDRDDLCRGGDSSTGRSCCRPDASEAPCEVQLQLSYDGGSAGGRHRIAALRLRLADANDNAPTFSQTSTMLRVPEGPLSSVGPPTSIPGAGGVFQASDPDQGANGAIVYRLTPAEPESGSLPFRLDQSDRNRLVLLVTGELDREKRSAYKMLLLAIDGGRPALTGTLSVTVELQDVNDEAPVFQQSEYSARLREDAPTGSVVVKVRATDRDAGANGEVHYSLSSTAGPLRVFRSADGEGTVTLQSPLDAETLPQFVVYIVAQDRGYPPKSAEAKLTVTVDDVNDERPRIEIVYLNRDSTAPSGSRGLLTENVNSVDVAKADVSDPDSGTGGRVTCQANNEGFELAPLHLSDSEAASAASGPASVRAGTRQEFLVRSRTPFDREAADGLLQFNIVCADGGHPVRLTSSAAVRLRLLDVNDNAPAFSRPSGYEFQLPENEPKTSGGRHRVGAVSAIDRDEGDNARVVYGIERDPSGAFEIDSGTGELFAVQPLDREKLATGRLPAQVQLSVSAADSNPSHRRAIADVQVLILDRNDCPPTFVNENHKVGIGGPGVDYEFSVKESNDSGGGGGSASSTVVGTVRAEDDDEPGPIEYAMETTGLDPDTAASFRVDRHSGQVRAIRPLDRETRAVYVFPVTAKDAPRPGSGDPRLTGTTTVTVHVLDINDCAPEFIVPASSGELISVADNARAGYSVTKVEARDSDLEENGRLQYTILPGSAGSAGSAAGGLFKLDPNGLVFMARSLTPRDARPEPYELVVEATDQGRPSPLRTRTTLRVFVVSADSAAGGKSATEAAGERRGGKTAGGSGGDSQARQRTRTTIVLGLIVFFFLLLIVVTFAVLIRLRPCRRGGGSGGIGGRRRDPAADAVGGDNDFGDVGGGGGGGVRDFKTVRGYLVAGNGKSGEPTTLVRGSIDAPSPPELYNLLTTGRYPPAGGNTQPADSTPMTVVGSMPARLSDYQSLRPATGQGTVRRKKPLQQQQKQQHQQHVLDEQSPVYYQAGDPVGAFGTARGFERANSAGLRTTATVGAAGAATQQQQQHPTSQQAASGGAKSQPVTPMDRRKFSAFNPYADASFV